MAEVRRHTSGVLKAVKGCRALRVSAARVCVVSTIFRSFLAPAVIITVNYRPIDLSPLLCMSRFLCVAVLPSDNVGANQPVRQNTQPKCGLERKQLIDDCYGQVVTEQPHLQS